MLSHSEGKVSPVQFFKRYRPYLPHLELPLSPLTWVKTPGDMWELISAKVLIMWYINPLP